MKEKSVTKSTPTLHQYAVFQAALDAMNQKLFDGVLPPCMITMQRKSGCMGYFHYQRFIATDSSGARLDEIAINPETLVERGLMQVLQTLAHEQCHQWQYHFGTPSQRTYHNREWADRMETIDLMPSSTGQPGGRRTGQAMADYPVPGGRFEELARDLIETRFRLPWADRFTPLREFVTLSVHDDGTFDGEEEERKPSNKTKVRYSHYCQADAGILNVWGRPSLSLLCAACGDGLVSIQEGRKS